VLRIPHRTAADIGDEELAIVAPCRKGSDDDLRSAVPPDLVCDPAPVGRELRISLGAGCHQKRLRLIDSRGESEEVPPGPATVVDPSEGERPVGSSLRSAGRSRMFQEPVAFEANTMRFLRSQQGDVRLRPGNRDGILPVALGDQRGE